MFVLSPPSAESIKIRRLKKCLLSCDSEITGGDGLCLCLDWVLKQLATGNFVFQELSSQEWGNGDIGVSGDGAKREEPEALFQNFLGGCFRSSGHPLFYRYPQQQRGRRAES